MSFRLLLIEDSPTQLLTISKTLQAEGYTVIEARNGAEGLARAYNELPDLIISDVGDDRHQWLSTLPPGQKRC